MVQDFLQIYHTDANELRQFSETIKIAESLPLSKDYDETERVDLVLDCVFNVKGVTFKGQTSQAYEVRNGSQKELVKKLRGLAYKKRGKLPRTCVPMNQSQSKLRRQAHLVFNPKLSSTQMPLQKLKVNKLVYKNSNVQQSFRYNEGYHRRFMCNQMEYSDTDQWIASLCASLASLSEESGTSKSPNDSVTAFTGDMQAIIRRTDELGTRCSRARCNSVCAVFSMLQSRFQLGKVLELPKGKGMVHTICHYTEDLNMHPTNLDGYNLSANKPRTLHLEVPQNLPL